MSHAESSEGELLAGSPYARGRCSDCEIESREFRRLNTAPPDHPPRLGWRGPECRKAASAWGPQPHRRAPTPDPTRSKRRLGHPRPRQPRVPRSNRKHSARPTDGLWSETAWFLHAPVEVLCRPFGDADRAGRHSGRTAECGDWCDRRRRCCPWRRSRWCAGC